MIYFIFFLSNQLVNAEQIVQFSEIKNEKAIYKLFIAHLSEVLTGTIIQNVFIYELNVLCKNRPLIAFPFESINSQVSQTKLTSSNPLITKQGSRLQVYAVNFKLQKFDLLYDGSLLDFYGAISEGDCPDLVGLRFVNYNRIKRVKLKYSSKLKKYF